MISGNHLNYFGSTPESLTISIGPGINCSQNQGTSAACATKVGRDTKKEAAICNICLSAPRNAVLVEWYHVYSCYYCALKTTRVQNPYVAWCTTDTYRGNLRKRNLQMHDLKLLCGWVLECVSVIHRCC